MELKKLRHARLDMQRTLHRLYQDRRMAESEEDRNEAHDRLDEARAEYKALDKEYWAAVEEEENGHDGAD